MKMDWIWMNGKLVPEQDANVHVLSHGLHYGSSFFEGIRAYETVDGRTAVFRLKEHLQRLHETAKIYKTEIPYSVEELTEATNQVIKENKLKSAYIRPLAYRGRNVLGVEPRKCPVDVAIAAWEWGAYLGEEGIENGIRVQVSSWRRMAPNTIPALAKAGGNYLSSQLIKMEAIDNGFEEGIALDYNGNISEGSGENIFVIKNGILYTPPLASSSLAGITRDTIIYLAKEMNYQIEEKVLPREFLYTADEIFLTGTAAEVTPVAEVDHLKVGNGKRGSITKQIQEAYTDAVTGKGSKSEEWLYYIQ